MINRVIEGLLPKIHSNQLTRNWLLNEEKEIKAMEALLLDEMSITQCTGYGAINGNFVVNRVIEGLLPKIHSNQLTRNWLLNEKNSFETIFY